MKPYEGLFVTIEGGEGVGKTTLAEGLKGFLEERGCAVVWTREPGGTPFAEKIRKLLLDEKEAIGTKSELLLFLSARASHIEQVILPALHAGKVVICERFHDSTIAYQGCGRQLGMEFVERVCHLAFEGFESDCTLFLDLDPKVGLMRRKTVATLDRLERERLQFHSEVRQGFLHLADKYPGRITILDASAPPEVVLAEAKKALEKLLLKR